MKDVISGAVTLVFGVIAAAMSLSLEVGRPSQPSPGFFPFLSAVGIAAFGTALLLQGLRNRHPPGKDAGGVLRWQAAACLVALAAYAQIMDFLGFTLSTFLLMSILFVLAGFLPWYRAVIAGATTAVISGLVFGVMLKMTLPAGPFGL